MDQLVLAYFDPFTGSLILQLLVAGTVGCVAFFRRSIYRLGRLVSRRPPRDEEQ